MTTVSIDEYLFRKSKNKTKKYDVYDKKGNFITRFGARGMQQYYDKIGLYSKYNHLDKGRRKRYYLRHGRSAKKNTAKWFAHHYLW